MDLIVKGGGEKVRKIRRPSLKCVIYKLCESLVLFKNEVRVHVTLHTVTANIFFYSQRTTDKEAIVTLREASGCSGPSRLQWKAARSSSGKI